MRVEDAAARAGADLRSRFDGVPTPEFRGSPRGSPVRTGVVVAVVVILFAIGLTAVVRSVRTSPTAAEGPGGPMWQTISIEKAFGAHAVVTNIDEIASGFVALGFKDREINHSVPRLDTSERARPSPFREWTSRDGVTWTPQAARGVPSSRSPDSVHVVQNGKRYVLVEPNEIFLSSDLRHWRRVQGLRRAASISVRPWRDGFDAIVAENLSADTQDINHYRSKDGLRWSRVDDPNSSSSTTIGAFNAVRVGGRWLALVRENGTRRLFTSPDRQHWTLLASNAPALIDDLVADRAGSRALAIEYQSDRRLGDRLWSTPEGTRWFEVGSFANRYPNATVDRLLQSGDWWVLGGFRGTKRKTPWIWATRNFVHWVGFAVFRSGRSAAVPYLAAHGDRVIGLAAGGTELVIWRRPQRALRLVTLSGVAQSSGGPRAVGSIVHSVRVDSVHGREITRVQVSADGHYAVDLPPGRYELRTECLRDRVTLRRADVRRNLVCQIR